MNSPWATDVPYKIARSRRRTLALQVSATAEVIVRAPRWTPPFMVRRFVHKHSDWLKRTLKQVQARQKLRQARQFLEGEIFSVWGEPRRLAFQAGTSDTARWFLEQDQVVIALPETSRKTKIIQQVLRAAYRNALEEHLHSVLPSLAARLDVSPKNFSIGFAQYRWGSCASSGRLRFNGRLAMMPPAIFEYVAVHELVHLRQMNHSRDFWALVEDVLPDYAQRRKWLRQNGAAYVI